jgi:heat shock protein HslJ
VSHSNRPRDLAEANANALAANDEAIREVSVMWRSMSRARTPAFFASMLLLGMFIEVMAQSIQGTAWNAVELYGKSVMSRSGADDHQQPYLVFGADGRMSGADGCSWLTAPYTVTASGIAFGTIAGSETACSTNQTAEQFRAALVSASQWRIVMGRLEFYGATGERFAVFEQRRAGSNGPVTLNAKQANWSGSKVITAVR